MMYALFKDGKQHSKAHSSREAATVEAYEIGAVVDWGADWIGDKPGRGLAGGYEIKEINEPSNEATK